MWRIGLLIGAIALIAVLMIAAGGPASAQSQSLPTVNYLGEGVGTYETSLTGFVVKRFGPFRFDLEPGPTYVTSNERDRVWEQSGANAAPPAIWEDVISFGNVEAGCTMSYVGVDDDLDGRRNGFYLNDKLIELIDEGMVFSGSFEVPESGELRLVAQDSVGGWRTECVQQETPTPTATNTPEPTDTPTPTSTLPPDVTLTPTSTLPPGVTVTPTSTATPETPPTVTPTEQPPTLEPSPTPEKNRESSCVRINFEVSGDTAARGLYLVQEVGGKELASWYALDGWQDSGWFKDIDISHENVYVRVVFYRGPDAAPVELVILNHAPDSPYGWMSWGVCHALEVGWPGEKPEGAVPVEPPAPSDQPEQGAVSGPEMPAPTPAASTSNTNEQTSSLGASLGS
jgi:hypothetical protein